MGYGLIASAATVQVLSPTLVNDVVYCTIRTTPSGVIAAMPIQAEVFNAGGGGPELTAFSEAIEQIMSDARVIAATGAQFLDPNGLLADQVAFTVQYVPPGTTGTANTNEALVPVASLNFTDGLIGAQLLQSVEAIIDAAYAALQEASGG